MYDLAPLRGATDALWTVLRDALRQDGIAAPDALSRDVDLMDAWRSRDLVLGQTCGLPYTRHLCGRVSLVGTPHYRSAEGPLPDPPGHYHSVLLVRADDPRDLSSLRGAAFGANGTDSQSGWAAPMRMVGGAFFGHMLLTGAHLASMAAVRDGRVDVAAIDRVTWELARRHTQEARDLRVVARTPSTPGLPLVTAHGEAARVRGAVERGMAALPPGLRDALGIERLVRFRPGDYDVLEPSAPPR